MDAINSLLLIRSVKTRPAIWDKYADSYKDKMAKELSWREICVELNDGYLAMDQREAQEFEKHAVKKWTQLRDSWIKSVKKQMHHKQSGSCVKPSRPYIYHDKMCFLEKIMGSITVHESADNSGDDNDEITEDNTIFIKEEKLEFHEPIIIKPGKSGLQGKRKLELTHNVLDDKMIRFNDSNQIYFPESENENRHLLFFKGLLPSLSSFNDDQTLEFHAGVIRLLQNIKRNTHANATL